MKSSSPLMHSQLRTLLNMVMMVVMVMMLGSMSVSGSTSTFSVKTRPTLCSLVTNNEYEAVMTRFLDEGTISTADQVEVNEVCDGKETPLMIACKGRNRDLVELLVVQGKANVNIRAPNTGDTALILASTHGNLGMVNILLEKGRANANIQKKSGATALMQASFAGHVEVVKALLFLGHANANIQDSAGNSAVLLASMKGYVNVVRVLVENGRADATIPNRGGWTSMQFSIHGGYPALADYILEQNPHIAHLEDGDGKTPIQSAVMSGNVEISKMLLSKYEVNGSTPFADTDMTPVQLACREGHFPIVDMMITGNYFDDINHKNSDGFSSLHFAALSGSSDIVIRLLSVPEVNIDTANVNGSTPLMLAAEKGSLASVVVLVEHGANANLQMISSGRAALHFACERGHKQVVNFLVNGGHVKDVNVKDKVGWPPMRFASYHGFQSIVVLLLEMGGNDASDSLVMASMKGHATVVSVLLKHGASPNFQKSNDKFSALMYAATRGYKDIVTSLLAMSNIDVNLHEKDGWTALMFASFAGHADIVQSLLNVAHIDVNVQCKARAMTAVMLACYQNHADVLKLLVDRDDLDAGLVSTYKSKNAEAFCRTSGSDEFAHILKTRAIEQRERKIGKWSKYKAGSENEF